MSYSAVATVVGATPATGDLPSLIRVGLIKQAATRIAAILPADDQREYRVCTAVLDGTLPSSWTTIVLEVLDIQGHLATPTDAQIDAAVTVAWTYYIKSRA